MFVVTYEYFIIAYCMDIQLSKMLITSLIINVLFLFYAIACIVMRTL